MTSADPHKPVLVIGYGNTLRGDDGFGPCVASLLAQRTQAADVEILTPQQLTQIQRAFIREQGIRTKPLPTSVRDSIESAKGRQMKKEMRHARTLSKRSVTGLEGLGLSKRVLNSLQEEWASSLRERARKIDGERKAIKRRRR